MKLRVFFRLVAAFLGFLVAGDVAFGSALRISEFMASNTRTLRDENGLYGRLDRDSKHDGQPINLGGWYLTDTRRNLREWSFPATN